jgi:hypothetical protein
LILDIGLILTTLSLLKVFGQLLNVVVEIAPTVVKKLGETFEMTHQCSRKLFEPISQ